MRRLSLLAVAGMAVGAFACAPTPGGPKNRVITLQLKANPTSLRADMEAASTVTATIAASDGSAVAGTVEISVDQGQFHDGMAALGKTVTITSNERGVAEAQLRCINDAGRPLAGTMRVTAVAKADANIPADVESTQRVEIRCAAVEDRSELVFTDPLEGATVNAPDGVEVVMSVLDFSGSAAATGLVEVRGPESLNLAPNLNPGTTPTRASRGLNVQVANGEARFYVLYPGDELTAGGSVPVPLEATFTSRLGQERTASRRFNYAQAVNRSAIAFVGATPSGPNVVIVGNSEAVMSAGQSSGDSVEFAVEIKDRAGNPPPAGTLVKFTCSADAVNGPAPQVDCESLSGIPLTQPDGGASQDNLPGVYVASTVELDATSGTERGLARVRFQPRATSVPGTVRLEASFRPAGLNRDVATAQDARAVVNLVDANTLSVSVEVVNRQFASDTGGSGILRLSARTGTTRLADRLVCVRLDASSASRAVLKDQADDNDTIAAVLGTDSEGVAEVTVAPVTANIRGPVLVYYSVVDTAYTAALDNNTTTDQRTACASFTNTQRADGSDQFVITRDAILGAIRFVSAEPRVIGTIGSSSLPTSSEIVFQVFDDENRPIGAGQTVEFELDGNGDPNATVTPLALTDDTGQVKTFLTAGNQAASIVIRARSERLGTVVSTASDPVAVVGGKPAWTNMHLSVKYPVMAGTRAVAGYRDPFEPMERPEPNTLTLQLVDRFSNRIERPYLVQWRAETGAIPPTSSTDGDGATPGTGVTSVPLQPGAPFAMETTPRFDERRASRAYARFHPDQPQTTYRVANPSDGLISVLAAVRGEESFTDVNGDGVFQRPYNDLNGNRVYDGTAEDCNDRGRGCGTATCTQIANVRDPARSVYTAANHELIEPFVDLPEPFLDRNGDGLRANCDVVDVTRLPIHHDVFRQQTGIGTYCNPYMDDPADAPLISTNPDTGAAYTVEECRQHWCPDWAPQWNCRDNPRTPEAITDPNDPNRIIGGRVLWCPDWRFKDLTGLTRSVENGFVGFPGIRGLVPDDQTPESTTATGSIEWDAMNGTLAYTAPGATGPGPAVTVGPPTGPVRAVRLNSSTAGRVMYALIDPAEFVRTMDFTATFTVTRGDPRAPFGDFDRALLRVAQSDQFIDGNNNGVWDDVNGCYDTDTLIWKTGELAAAHNPYFSTSDWRLPPAATPDGVPLEDRTNVVAISGIGRYPDDTTTPVTSVYPVKLYDHIGSFFHVVPNGRETADSYYMANRFAGVDRIGGRAHGGAGEAVGGATDDFFVVSANETQVFALRLEDINGVPVAMYGTTEMLFLINGISDNVLPNVTPAVVQGYAGGTVYVTMTQTIDNVDTAAFLFHSSNITLEATVTYEPLGTAISGSTLVQSMSFSIPGFAYHYHGTPPTAP